MNKSLIFLILMIITTLLVVGMVYYARLPRAALNAAIITPSAGNLEIITPFPSNTGSPNPISSFKSNFIDTPGVEKIIKMTPEQRHDSFHYPSLAGKIDKATPYLTIPFKKSVVALNPSSFQLVEGWMYSKEERDIHGMTIHGAVDYQAPYGTQLYSPVDGYAIASYESFYMTDGSKILYYQKNPVQVGFGYHVQIYMPDQDRYLVLGHLSDLDPSIPFVTPRKVGNGWFSPVRDFTGSEMIARPEVVKIKRGDPIGKLGLSGLNWNYNDYKAGATRPLVLTEDQIKSWDEPHLHLEEYWMDPATKVKGWRRDPYALYDYYTGYKANIIEPAKMGKDPLFLLDQNGQPQFALN